MTNQLRDADVSSAKKILARLCEEGLLRMSIPVRQDDEDMILSRIINFSALRLTPEEAGEQDSGEAFKPDWVNYRQGVADGKAEAREVTEDMVSRFLGWQLPKTFSPDCGISFKALPHPNGWPIGTNLFTATEARAMLEHILSSPAPSVSDKQQGAALTDSEAHAELGARAYRAAFDAGRRAAAEQQAGMTISDEKAHEILLYMANECDDWAEGLNYEPTAEQCSGKALSIILREVASLSTPAAAGAQTPAGYEKMRGGKPVTFWRDDALEAAAGIVEAYGADPQIAVDIRAMKSTKPEPASACNWPVCAVHHPCTKDCPLHTPAAPASAPSEGAKLPSVCDGKEQDAFEAWAKSQRYDMHQHPMFYLFLTEKTASARDGWKAGLSYAVERMRGLAPTAPALPEGYKLVPIEPTKAMIDAGHMHTMRADEEEPYRARGEAIACYSDMIAAAPSTTPEPGEEGGRG